MKFFLKFVALLALIVAGKLSKPSSGAVLASEPKLPVATGAFLVNQHPPTPSISGNLHQPEPPRAQVLSVFFK